jgi:F0F1-type ATP synthase assembly protein I
MSGKPEPGMGGMGANQLAGCVVVGVALGWLSQKLFPQIAPWGYASGVILGAAAGLWQVLKSEGALGKYRPKDKDDGSPEEP